jgi:hypothetical protein
MEGKANLILNAGKIDILHKMVLSEIDADKVKILGERIDDVERRFSRPSLMMMNSVVGA